MDIEEIRKLTDEQKGELMRHMREKYAQRWREERMLKQHGRLISGYCSCCGGIRELSGVCAHTEECSFVD